MAHRLIFSSETSLAGLFLPTNSTILLFCRVALPRFCHAEASLALVQVHATRLFGTGSGHPGTMAKVRKTLWLSPFIPALSGQTLFYLDSSASFLDTYVEVSGSVSIGGFIHSSGGSCIGRLAVVVGEVRLKSGRAKSWNCTGRNSALSNLVLLEHESNLC